MVADTTPQSRRFIFYRRDSSPYTGEPRTRSISLGEHRGAEKCAPSHSLSTGEPRLARRGRSRVVHRISLGEHKESRLVRIFAPCGYFHENLYKNSPPRSEKAQKESSGPFAVGYSEKTPGTAVQRTQTFPRPTANGSCGGSIPQNACFGTEWKG